MVFLCDQINKHVSGNSIFRLLQKFLTEGCAFLFYPNRFLVTLILGFIMIGKLMLKSVS